MRMSWKCRNLIAVWILCIIISTLNRTSSLTHSMPPTTELDRLYQPSRWCKRFSTSEEVLNYHLQYIESASEKVRRTIPCQLNTCYGSSERQKFDVFGSDLCDESPLFVFIHGGYWQEHVIRRDSYHFIAKNLYKNGIKSVFLGYDLCPDVTLPQIVRQIEVASRRCIEYAKNKGSRGVYFAGHSAGAHLVASLFLESVNLDRSVIKGAILISGVYDLQCLQKTIINGPLRMDAKVALEMSPLKHNLTGNSGETEFLVVVGAYESPEFIKQAEELTEKLNNSGFKACFEVLKEVDHYNIVEFLSEQDFELSKWIVNMINNRQG